MSDRQFSPLQIENRTECWVALRNYNVQGEIDFTKVMITNKEVRATYVTACFNYSTMS